MNACEPFMMRRTRITIPEIFRNGFADVIWGCFGSKSSKSESDALTEETQINGISTRNVRLCSEFFKLTNIKKMTQFLYKRLQIVEPTAIT